MALVRGLPGVRVALSSALVPVLVLPTLPHFEARYLLGALPGIALVAGMGLGSLGRRRSGLAAALVFALTLRTLRGGSSALSL